MLCVLIVEGMSVVVNVMLSVMSPPPALCNLSVRTDVKLCIFGVLALGVSLVSWIESPFMLTCSMRFISLLLLGLYVCVVLVVLW